MRRICGQGIDTGITLHPHRLFAPAILLLAIIFWTFLAPEEATLKSAIRWVYLHVAFIWAGAAIINFAGVLGIVLLVRPIERIAQWVYPLELIAVGLYSTGFLLSLISAWTAWGGVLWQEPRVITSMLVIAAGCGALLLLRSLKISRVTGLITIVYAVLLSYQLGATSLVLHPDEPINASESTGIRLTFYGLTILAIALGVSLVWFAQLRREHRDRGEDNRQSGKAGQEKRPPAGELERPKWRQG